MTAVADTTHADAVEVIAQALARRDASAHRRPDDDPTAADHLRA